MKMAPQNKTERVTVGCDDEGDIHDVKFANRDCCFCMPCHGSIWLQRLAMNDTNSILSTHRTTKRRGGRDGGGGFENGRIRLPERNGRHSCDGSKRTELVTEEGNSVTIR
ncbi:hypothetical protein F3Y22_tig00110621pilonHSYRG00301 [Hibiscus syriacus]|uniref:Uncharacterized protein n=1 Tax=Hibiscus syriacus TaxID=106335 RepID=A0A6A3A2P8_HIBSY|nr:hypothetical protein F3Y22_tig00110621pilonHSYRG00301 [Hibiscus syriacus]